MVVIVVAIIRVLGSGQRERVVLNMQCIRAVVAVNARGGGVGVAGELASQVCMHACMPWSSTRERWRGGVSVSMHGTCYGRQQRET